MFWLESSSIGMNIANARKKRGNSLNLFRPLFTLRLELVPQTTIAHCPLPGGGDGPGGTSPAASILRGEGRTGDLKANS
jgi:hypothetical protein